MKVVYLGRIHLSILDDPEMQKLAFKLAEKYVQANYKIWKQLAESFKLVHKHGAVFNKVHTK